MQQIRVRNTKVINNSSFKINLIKEEKEKEEEDDMESFEIDNSGDSLLNKENQRHSFHLSSSSSSSLSSSSSHNNNNLNNEQQLSFFVIVAFTVNYVMGTGFLTLPWAFYKSGPLLGGIVLFFMIGPSLMSVSFILETITRANLLIDNSNNNNNNNNNIQNDNDNITEINHKNYNSKVLPIVGIRKYETTELCEIFLGTTGKKAYTLSIAIFLYGTLWAYATVFANALVAHFDIFGSYSYYIYLLLYSIIVVPLSCMELSEQLYLQVILSICRIFMVIFMVGTVIYAFFTHEDLFHIHSSSSPSYISFDQLIKWNGLHFILPIAVYSNMFHHSIPSLSEPAANKKKLGYMFATSLLCCFVAYTLIGIIVSMYFGEAILSSSNLNWKEFGYHNSSKTSHFLIILQRFISFFIIIFPALDVSSAYPLNAITLGNNLYTSIYNSDLQLNSSSNKTLFTYRLFASIPPIIFAAFISDLGTITDYTGITGMLVVFVFPGLLSMASEKHLKFKNIPPNTYYSSIFTTRKASMLVVLFGIVMIVFTLISLILSSS